MHVCVLTAERFPPDERIGREAKALRRGGHSVTVCARGATGQPDREIVDGIDVRRLDDLYAGVGGTLDGVRYALGYIQPAWVRAASETNAERTVSVCCVRDRSLVKTGLKVGDELDVPVVLDLPDATTNTETSSAGRLQRVAKRVFHSSWRRERLVTNGLANADHIVTTCEEARAAYVRGDDIDPGRVAVVYDTVSSVAVDPAPEAALGFGFDPEMSFVVTAFIEGCAKDDLEAVVEATARAADDVAALKLVFVGDPGQETLDALETLARRRLVGGRVTFRTEADSGECVAASDVCVFPAAPGSATAIPVELFEAMAMGVPIVTGDGAPARRIVTRANAGRVVSLERDAVAEALVELASPGVGTELGANGRRALDGVFDPERDASRLRAVYESLAAVRATR